MSSFSAAGFSGVTGLPAVLAQQVAELNAVTMMVAPVLVAVQTVMPLPAGPGILA